MKTAYIDPLIPLGEDRHATLVRLSANIGTLTELIDGAEHSGLDHLAAMLTHSRSTKVREATGLLASPAGDGHEFPAIPPLDFAAGGKGDAPQLVATAGF